MLKAMHKFVYTHKLSNFCAQYLHMRQTRSLSVNRFVEKKVEREGNDEGTGHACLSPPVVIAPSQNVRAN